MICAAAVAGLAAVSCCRFRVCAVAFAEKEFLGYADIDIIPRQKLVFAEFAVRVERGIDAGSFKCLQPFVIMEMLVPTVEAETSLVCFGERGIELSVASCENGFDAADLSVVVIVFDLSVGDLFVEITLLLKERFHFALRFPLERREDGSVFDRIRG